MTTAGLPRQVHYAQHEQALLRVSKADKKTLGLMAEGVYLSTSTARALLDLQEQTCVDRLTLARELLGAADKLTRSRPAQYRSAISRYYYAMYHAMRAVVYYAYGGDDHNEHTKSSWPCTSRFRGQCAMAKCPEGCACSSK